MWGQEARRVYIHVRVTAESLSTLYSPQSVLQEKINKTNNRYSKMSRLPVCCSAYCTFSQVKTSGKFFGALTDDMTIGWICGSSKMKPTSDKSRTINQLHLLGPLGTFQMAPITVSVWTVCPTQKYQLLREKLGSKGNTHFEKCPWWLFFWHFGSTEIDNNMANIGN